MTMKGKVLTTVASVLLLALAITAAYFLINYRILSVPTGAMANTILPGDRVLCQMRIEEIKRGDIALFKLPADPAVFYLKRVIGLPGETIQVIGARVFINGQELAESKTFVDLSNREGALKELSSEGEGAYRVFYEKREGDVQDEFSHAKYAVTEPFQIPPGHYFVLGDCRDNSLDSRYWGTLPRDLIVGKALMIVDSSASGGQERAFKRLK